MPQTSHHPGCRGWPSSSSSPQREQLPPTAKRRGSSRFHGVFRGASWTSGGNGGHLRSSSARRSLACQRIRQWPGVKFITAAACTVKATQAASRAISRPSSTRNCGVARSWAAQKWRMPGTRQGDQRQQAGADHQRQRPADALQAHARGRPVPAGSAAPVSNMRPADKADSGGNPAMTSVHTMNDSPEGRRRVRESRSRSITSSSSSRVHAAIGQQLG